MDASVILAGATIEGRLWNNGLDASSSSVPMHKHAHVYDPSLNIFRHRFDFCPQLSTFPSLPHASPTCRNLHRRSRRSEARHLLTTDVNYANIDKCVGQDNFLLVHPLHRQLFPWLTRPLLSALLLVAMENPRTRGVNITNLPSEILEIMAAKVAKMLLAPLDDIVSLCCS
jgi:hypothetical protein